MCLYARQSSYRYSLILFASNCLTTTGSPIILISSNPARQRCCVCDQLRYYSTIQVGCFMYTARWCWCDTLYFCRIARKYLAAPLCTARHRTILISRPKRVSYSSPSIRSLYALYLWNRLELDAHIFTQS